MRKHAVMWAVMLSLWASVATAQVLTPLPVNGSLVSANDAVTGAPGSASSVSIQLTGTWTGTVTFRASGNGGQTYVDILGASVTTGALGTTTTANGMFVFANGGYDAIRAVFTTATSGTVLVSMDRGYAQAKIASPQFTNVIADSLCMSSTTKDSYFQEVSANNPGAYTGGTSCAGGTLRFDWNNTRFNFAQPILFTPDNTHDIGASGATRPRNIFAGGTLTIDGVSTFNSRSNWNGQVGLNATGNGKFGLLDSSGATVNQLNINTPGTFSFYAADGSTRATIDALAYNAAGSAGVTGTCDTPTFTSGVATICGGSGGSVDGNYFVTSNFTTAANTNLQAITGLAWTFPANTALNVPMHCSLVYSQATAAVADSLGIQDVTVAPTNAMFAGQAETTLTAVAFGDLTAFSSTTATAVVTFTPGVIATTYNLYLDGFIEQPSNVSASVFNVMIKTSASADVITVYRGSYCKVG